MMKLADLARVAVVVAATVAAAASSASHNNNTAQTGQYPGNDPPQPMQMDATRAVGLWQSSFGAVKIEPDQQGGGLQAGNVQGAWSYNRQGQQVVGLFYGNLRGNVLQFHWQEPAQPPLVGEGFLVFDPNGYQFSGKWWSGGDSRHGEWTGRRFDPNQAAQQGQPYNQAQQGQPYTPAQGQPYTPAQQQPYTPAQQPQGYPQQGQQPYAPQGQPSYPQQHQQAPANGQPTYY